MQAPNKSRLVSAQNSMLAVICRLLVKRQALDHDELVNELHELLSLGLVSQPAATGPIKHLLSMFENEG